jgi:hypothetical protein
MKGQLGGRRGPSEDERGVTVQRDGTVVRVASVQMARDMKGDLTGGSVQRGWSEEGHRLSVVGERGDIVDGVGVHQ